MTTMHEILTEFGNQIASRQRIYDMTGGNAEILDFAELIKTAIANATEQIKAQQRERVERAKEMLLEVVKSSHVSKIYLVKAAIKELEAEGEV